MARSRNIKPGFFRNERLAELPFETRLLFIGLWTFADRDGRFEVRPKRIKGELFPYDDTGNVADGIASLADAGFLTLYREQGGPLFAEITNWHKHQNPHFREAPSVIPPPPGTEPEASPRLADAEPEASPADSGFLIPDSRSLIPSNAFALPDWMDRDAWNDWDAYRTTLGKKEWTDKAKELSIRRLEKFREEGSDPRDVIEQSIANGYRGLFADKGKTNGQGKRGAAERVAAATRERVRRGQ